jgi:hypothetical protein
MVEEQDKQEASISLTCDPEDVCGVFLRNTIEGVPDYTA